MKFLKYRRKNLNNLDDAQNPRHAYIFTDYQKTTENERNELKEKFQQRLPVHQRRSLISNFKWQIFEHLSRSRHSRAILSPDQTLVNHYPRASRESCLRREGKAPGIVPRQHGYKPI